MAKIDNRYTHETMEVIKVKTVIDGDLACTIHNAFVYLDEHDLLWDEDAGILFCGHVVPKLEKFIKLLEKETNIEERPEK